MRYHQRRRKGSCGKKCADEHCNHSQWRDAPGINAAIDCFTRLAAQSGDQALGAPGGFAGLLAGQLAEIDRSLVSLLAGRGGSILPSSRAPVLQEPDARERLLDVMHRREIDNLLLFGGDGTIQHVAPLLASWGISCIVLPTTIDNDVAATEYTLGHDSACNFALHALAGIRATAHALPGRVFLLETLGAPSGHLALAIAYASSAHLALLPEYPLQIDWLAQRLTQGRGGRGPGRGRPLGSVSRHRQSLA